MRHAFTLIAATLLTSVFSYAHAQQYDGELGTTPAAQSTSTVTLSAGENLHIVIRKGFRIKGLRQAVTGEVTEPVFVGDRQVIAPGTIVRGHITALSTAAGRVRLGRLLDGDFTPPKVASVTFVELIEDGGRTISLQTEEATQLLSAKMFLYKSKQDRPKVSAQVRTQVFSVIHTPNKLEKVSEAGLKVLPLHPEFVDEGTLFNSRLITEVSLPELAISTISDVPVRESEYLHLRLLTPLNSESARAKQLIEAVVSTPFYDKQQRLLYPAGVLLNGNVIKSKQAGWLQKQGSLNLQLTSICRTEGKPQNLEARIVGVEAAKGQALSIDDEGVMKATYSPLKRITAPLSLLGPSRGLADSSREKTAFQRGGQGRKGFGLFGTGAAQASASASAGFGYYGAARKLYGSFIAKGTDVDLPANTLLLLAMNR